MFGFRFLGFRDVRRKCCNTKLLTPPKPDAEKAGCDVASLIVWARLPQARLVSPLRGPKPYADPEVLVPRSTAVALAHRGDATAEIIEIKKEDWILMDLPLRGTWKYFLSVFGYCNNSQEL